MLYWFATLLDAERIERALAYPERIADAKLHAAGWHEPERLDRAWDHALEELRQPFRPPLTTDQLLAIAREAQRKANAGLLPPSVS